MHKQIGKDRACGSGDILADIQTQTDRPTDRHTHHNTSQPLPWAKYLQVALLSQLECGPVPNVMAALPNIGGALCSTLQSLADAHY